MKNNILSLLSLTTLCCLTIPNLSAWERTAMKTCKKEEQSCKKYAEDCKKNNPKCKKKTDTCSLDAKECKENAADDDISSFTMALSSFARTTFSQFSMEQKKKAMDLADGNKMTPDDAVTKVAGHGCTCHKESK